ncbi:MAG: futalosine hydrolase [Ferruginibacter sp.]|nr:futalosine hydrolase [Ferruginibacter sp.]
MKCNYEFCSMHILLVSATTFEIAPTFLLLEKEQYKLNGHTVEVLITGVGQVNTTYFLTVNLHNKKADLVIQAGIAGTFVHRLNLSQTVLIKKDTFGDVGMEEKQKFTTIFDAGFADKDDFPFNNGWLVNTNELLNQLLLPSVNAITVNKVSDSLLQRQQLKDHFTPEIESMEGAAFHYVCLQQKISFIQIRSISNAVGERDKSKWAIKDATVNLNIELQKLINSLP